MKPSASLEEFRRESAAIEAELLVLARRDAQLQSALEDVEHDARRSNDALERAGWRSIQAETRGALLAENRGAIVDDRKRIRLRRESLDERLKQIRQRLKENEVHD